MNRSQLLVPFLSHLHMTSPCFRSSTSGLEYCILLILPPCPVVIVYRCYEVNMGIYCSLTLNCQLCPAVIFYGWYEVSAEIYFSLPLNSQLVLLLCFTIVMRLNLNIYFCNFECLASMFLFFSNLHLCILSGFSLKWVCFWKRKVYF